MRVSGLKVPRLPGYKHQVVLRVYANAAYGIAKKPHSYSYTAHPRHCKWVH